jgi:hypothetical protein
MELCLVKTSKLGLCSIRKTVSKILFEPISGPFHSLHRNNNNPLQITDQYYQKISTSKAIFNIFSVEEKHEFLEIPFSIHLIKALFSKSLKIAEIKLKGNLVRLGSFA